MRRFFYWFHPVFTSIINKTGLASPIRPTELQSLNIELACNSSHRERFGFIVSVRIHYL